MSIADVICVDFIAKMSHGVFQVAKTVRPDYIRIPEHILLASNAVDSVIFHCIILPALFRCATSFYNRDKNTGCCQKLLP